MGHPSSQKFIEFDGIIMENSNRKATKLQWCRSNTSGRILANTENFLKNLRLGEGLTPLQWKSGTVASCSQRRLQNGCPLINNEIFLINLQS